VITRHSSAVKPPNHPKKKKKKLNKKVNNNNLKLHPTNKQLAELLQIRPSQLAD
jgi:hypothetical protein